MAMLDSAHAAGAVTFFVSPKKSNQRKATGGEPSVLTHTTPPDPHFSVKDR